ncbi:MAG: hypothetical protein AB1490_15835 [Pseudomonadota bacterium]
MAKVATATQQKNAWKSLRMTFLPRPFFSTFREIIAEIVNADHALEAVCLR